MYIIHVLDTNMDNIKLCFSSKCFDEQKVITSLLLRKIHKKNNNVVYVHVQYNIMQRRPFN